MITEKIVISDTNILLDLLSQNMLEDFFSLPCDICTTDFVIGEIVQPVQQKVIDSFVRSRKLDVIKFNPSELSDIANLFLQRIKIMLLLQIVLSGIMQNRQTEDY